MTIENITIYELLNAADLLIADYSSVYVEYLLLERPVLFLHKDYNQYEKSRGIILGDPNIWFPGPSVEKITDFIIELDKLLLDSNYYCKHRKNFKHLMFSKNLNICENIFNFFFDKTNFSLKHTAYISEKDNLISRISELNNQMDLYEKKLQTLEKNNSELKLSNNQLLEKNKSLLDELNTIYASKSWKLLRLFQKIKKGGKR